MVEHELWFTAVLNRFFGGIVAAMLVRVSQIPHLSFLHPQDPLHPIPNYAAGEVLVALVIIVAALILRGRLSMENPGKFQQAMEVFLQFTQNMADDMIGHGARRYVPMIGTLGLFVLVCNAQGLIPSLVTPTANIEVTLGCAVVTFLYYNFHAIRERGIFGYMRHLCGPVPAVAPVMLIVEIPSNILRMLSLSVRLWANMLAGGLVVAVWISLVPIVAPSAFILLHMVGVLLQAYVFMILPALYIGLALSEEH